MSKEQIEEIRAERDRARDREAKPERKSLLAPGMTLDDMTKTRDQALLDEHENTLARSFIKTIRHESTLPVIHLPFPKLDDFLGGLTLHSLTTITASSGKGKTSLAVQIAAHHAETNPTIYYVGEMTPQIIVARLIGQRTKRPWLDVLRGKIKDDEMYRVLAKLHLHMVKRDPDPVGAIARMVDVATKLHPGIPMIVIDYVQLLADLSKGDARIATVTAIDEIKQYVEDHDVVGVMLSQASRPGAKLLKEGVEDAADAMSAGAETAQLENASTNMLSVSYASKDGVKIHDVTMLVAKSRFGGGKKLPFKYNGENGVWSEGDVIAPTDAETQLEEDILRHIDVHYQVCTAHPPDPTNLDVVCYGAMTQEALYKAGSKHKIIKVADHKVKNAVKRLVDKKVIDRHKGQLRRVGYEPEKQIGDLIAKPSSALQPLIDAVDTSQFDPDDD